MGSVFSVAGIAVSGAMLCLLLKNLKSEFAPLCAVGTTIIVILFALGDIHPFLSQLSELTDAYGISGAISVVLKALGIAVATQISADLCRDSGEGTIATAVEFAGKASILLVCLPVLRGLIDLGSGLLEG